jgi:hypothetical protein
MEVQDRSKQDSQGRKCTTRPSLSLSLPGTSGWVQSQSQQTADSSGKHERERFAINDDVRDG